VTWQGRTRSKVVRKCRHDRGEDFAMTIEAYLFLPGNAAEAIAF